MLSLGVKYQNAARNGNCDSERGLTVVSRLGFALSDDGTVHPDIPSGDMKNPGADERNRGIRSNPYPGRSAWEARAPVRMTGQL